MFATDTISDFLAVFIDQIHCRTAAGVTTTRGNSKATPAKARTTLRRPTQFRTGPAGPKAAGRLVRRQRLVPVQRV